MIFTLLITTPKIGIKGTNLYFFYDTQNLNFFKKFFFEILNLKKSVCLKN